jgi:hypothetical protein
MTSRITLFDPFAHSLTELSGIPTTPRSWVLNSIGRAEFSISTSDSKCTEMNFQFGNLIHIEHIPSKDADGSTLGKLPDWTGVILPPRTWDLGVLHAEAYTAEVILAFRPMPFVKIAGTPKVIFLEILKHANDFARRYGGVIVQPGTIENINQTFTDDLRLSAREHIAALTKNAGMDWDVTGEIDETGNLQLYANLYAHKGRQTEIRTGIYNTDLTMNNRNSELASPLLTEQGNLYNVVVGYSQVPTEAQRVQGVGVNHAALGVHGVWGISETFAGLKDVSAVRAAAQQIADRRGQAVRVISRTSLDLGSTLSRIDTGDVIAIEERNAGFAPGGGFGIPTTPARILSITYNDLSNRAPLNLEVL